MKRKVRLILYSIAAILICIYLLQFKQTFNPRLEHIIPQKDTPSLEFTSSVSRSDKGYIVRLQNVTAGTSESGRNIFVRMDVVIGTPNKKTADSMGMNKARTAAAITEAVVLTGPDTLRTQYGKEILKRNIEKTISSAYGAEAAQDIYFENFIYE